MSSTNYYKTNALYDYLTTNPNPKFYFTSGNMWQVIYGDAQSNPRLLLLIVGMVTTQLSAPITENEKQAKQLLSWLSGKIGIPLLHIRFADDVTATPINSEAEIKEVTIIDEMSSPTTVELNKLAAIYRDFGLPVPLRYKATVKPVNDATSSAYHKWQRSALGPITVSDVDLWAIDTNTPKRIFELKRSRIPLATWKPYQQDYANFRLLYKTFTPANLKVFIAYNFRQESPWNDDISQLKVFLLDFSPGKNPPYDEVTLPYPLEKFLAQ